MKAWFHPSVGLVGRIVAIVLLTILIEFCASTLLYDRAASLRIREDEAHRVAEHLAASSRVMDQRRAAERPAMAARLSSKNFYVRWIPAAPSAPPMSADLLDMRDQITSWEPSLAHQDLRLYLRAPGRDTTVTGRLQLADGTWLFFKAPQLVDEHKFRVGWLAMMLIVAVSLSLIAWIMIRWTLRPVRTLSEAASQIGHGEQQHHIQEMGGDEVRGLIRAFNEMQARIHSLISDRMEALAAVSHDLRTPLSRLQLRAEGITDPELRGEIAGDIREMAGMVSSLLAYFAGDEDPEAAQPVDVAVVAATLVDEICDMGGEADYFGPGHLEYPVRPIGFKRALRNIIENAAKYGKRVRVDLRRGAEKGFILTIDDDGPGIAEHRLQDVLKPFVRLDPARGRDTNGLGLGLAIAAKAIEREGGSITLSNRAEGGLRVGIFIPAVNP